MEKINPDALYFTFKLEDGIFAVPVTDVKEVLNYEPCTKVPKSLPYMSGVLNVRGSIITIIDFRLLLGFSPSKNVEKTRIIVTETQADDKEEVSFGVIVDDVEGVTQLKNVPSDVSTYGTLSERKDFIKAVGRNGDDFVLVLDVNNIYTSIEKEILESKTKI